MKNAALFVYIDSMQIEVENKREVLLDDVDPLYIYKLQEGACDTVPRNKVTGLMTREGYKNSAINIMRDHAMDAPIVRIRIEKCTTCCTFFCMLCFDTPDL